MQFKSFFDFIEFVHAQKMCTQPGCTTCGCMPFRNYCKDQIGFSEMCDLINAVTYEQSADQDPEDWYEPLRIIYDVVFHDLPIDAPLMKEYFSIRARLLADKQARRAATEARILAEKEQAAQRRAEKAQKAAEHRERSRIKNEEYRKLHGGDRN